MLNPNNIKGKTFDTEKNGYSKEDVKEFLGQVAEGLCRSRKGKSGYRS